MQTKEKNRELESVVARLDDRARATQSSIMQKVEFVNQVRARAAAIIDDAYTRMCSQGHVVTNAARAFPQAPLPATRSAFAYTLRGYAPVQTATLARHIHDAETEEARTGGGDSGGGGGGVAPFTVFT